MDTVTSLIPEDDTKFLFKFYWQDPNGQIVPRIVGLNKASIFEMKDAKVEDLLAQLILLFKIPGTITAIVPGTVKFSAPVESLREFNSLAIVLGKNE